MIVVFKVNIDHIALHTHFGVLKYLLVGSHFVAPITDGAPKMLQTKVKQQTGWMAFGENNFQVCSFSKWRFFVKQFEGDKCLHAHR